MTHDLKNTRRCLTEESVQQNRKKSRRKRIMEEIRFEFRMEMRKIQSKTSGTCRRISYN
jgi:hypothetical protein